MNIKIATSQFPISADIQLNRDHILGQMRDAAKKGCDIIHFPEGSLSGYAGIDFPTFDNYDWGLLKKYTQEIMEQAGALNLWVILGSAHPLTGNHKPHNSLYIINNLGKIVDRYDKRFCAGDPEQLNEDLAHFTSGNHECIFEINQLKCSTLICHEYRYPELYRSLLKKDVRLVFHSYHAGNMNAERQKTMTSEVGKKHFQYNPGKTLPEITMPATMISYAANNYVWISCSNTSARESCWASFMVRPDGVIVGALEKNATGILISTIDIEKVYYDSTRPWRRRAINGVYYSGEKVKDPEDRRKEDRCNEIGPNPCNID